MEATLSLPPGRPCSRLCWAGLGVALGPFVVTLHELGHAAAAAASGASFSVRAMATAIVPGPGPLNMTAILVGGPAVDILLTVGGLLLVVRRRRQRSARPNVGDIVAAALALTSVRWLTRVPAGAAIGVATGTYANDEALTSIHAGAPVWVVPGLLALAGSAVVRVMRRLPPASRRGDVIALLCGQGVGLALWSTLPVG